ncbi:MAG: hypothetical protein ABI885_25670, partial [Gammaproteobacteria bacterium]
MKTRIRIADRLTSKDYHSTIITTFGVDFATYENLALPRLRSGASNNNILLVDTRMLTLALDGASALPRLAGKGYSVCGVNAQGVFHPKVVFQVGRTGARLMISSANMTAPGMGGNVEITGMLELDASKSGERALAAAIWFYLKRLIKQPDTPLEYQLEWMQARSDWLRAATLAGGVVELADGTLASFLASSPERGIGERFVELVEAAHVERLIVVSPYWDDDLAALKFLIDRLSPARVSILIEAKRAAFPGDALKHLPHAEVYDVGASVRPSFLHAKLFVVQTADADHVLYGSANCTSAALGSADFAGINEEACLYRRLPAGAALATLGLSDVLDGLSPTAADDLPEMADALPIPLNAAASRFPGDFEATRDELRWIPPYALRESQELQGVKIELLNAEGELLQLPLILRAAHPLPGSRAYGIEDNSGAVAFARLRFADLESSALAVVSRLDDIVSAVHERLGKAEERAARYLLLRQDPGLLLLEALTTLIDAQATAEKASRARTAVEGTEADAPREFKTVDYAAFTAHRLGRPGVRGVARSALAGSGPSLVQACLNALLNLGSARGGHVDLDEPLLTPSIEEAEGNPASSSPPPPPNADLAFVEERLTPQQFVDALQKHIRRSWDVHLARPVANLDILRLRAILMVIASASTSLTSSELRAAAPAATDGALSRLLPVDGDHSWAWLISRLLYTVFGSPAPAFLRLQIVKDNVDLPEDILECWATCIWAFHACAQAAASVPTLNDLRPRLTGLVLKSYALMDLGDDELDGPLFLRVLTAMSVRFGAR